MLLPLVNLTNGYGLIADYKKDWLSSRISFQDVRLWGNDNVVAGTGMFGNNASTAIFEAWTELSFLSNSSIRIGRQTFDYDDSRICRSETGTITAGYDALLYKPDVPGWQNGRYFFLQQYKKQCIWQRISC